MSNNTLPCLSLMLPMPLPMESNFPPPPATTVTEIEAFKSLLFRDTNKQQVEEKCRELLQRYGQDWSSVYALFQVIRYTRETLMERDLTYLQLLVWYDTLTPWAAHALVDCVYSYGSWKDIKYLCEYCRVRNNNRTDHPLILYAICVLENQLKHDSISVGGGVGGIRSANVSERRPWSPASYAAKWTPREKSKHGWIYTMLSVSYFGYLTGAVTLEQQTKALTKSKMELRKIVSALNKHLDTVEIKQCANQWKQIQHVPTHAAFKYHRAFCRHSVDLLLPLPPQLQGRHRPYPYANVTTLANRINKEHELDKELETVPSPPPPITEGYRDHLNQLVSSFFNRSSGKALSILDLATLSPHDRKQSIGRSCVDCDGVLVLNDTGKYQFVAFTFPDFCNRIQELSKVLPPSAATPATSSIASLKTVSLFMERCVRDTVMTDKDREDIRILVFSRYPDAAAKKELEEIFSNKVFELAL